MVHVTLGKLVSGYFRRAMHKRPHAKDQSKTSKRKKITATNIYTENIYSQKWLKFARASSSKYETPNNIQLSQEKFAK